MGDLFMFKREELQIILKCLFESQSKECIGFRKDIKELLQKVEKYLGNDD